MRKELAVDEWFTEIRDGLEYRKLYGREASWNELEALFYEGKDLGDARGPNLIASIGDAMLSQLSSIYPYFMVKPRRQDLVLNARILESVDNSLLEELDIVTEMGFSMLHAFLWGKGFLKIGFDSEYGWSPFNLSEEESMFGLSLSQFDNKGNRLEYCEKVVPGMPWVSNVLPHDIVVPWGVTNLKDSPFVAHRVVRHIEDIKSDSKYSNKRNLRPTMTREEFVKSYQTVGDFGRLAKVSSVSDAVRCEYCELWEIRDVRTGKIKVIATGHDKFLRSDVDALQTQGLPFVDFSLVPTTRSFWTTPDAFYLLPYQKELNDISLQAAKHRKLLIAKFLYSAGSLDDEELVKLMSSDVCAGVKVNQGTPLDEAVKVFTPSEPNMTLYGVDAEYIRRCSRETVGFSRNQMGEYEYRGRRTASEVMAVQEGSSIKMSRRQMVIRRVYLDLIKKINSIIFNNWRAPKWVEVGGTWTEYDGAMLKGDYGYDLSFAQQNPVENPRQRALENLNLYQMLVQDPFVDQAKLRDIVQGSMPNPEYRKVFKNASVQLPMSDMQQQGGSPMQGGGQEQTGM